MGSTSYMERNGRKYAYESTSGRVPGRKSPVTDKVYLGRVGPGTHTSEIHLVRDRTLPARDTSGRALVGVLPTVAFHIGCASHCNLCVRLHV